MKAIMILWALGLAECGKLDRVYLPPTNSGVGGVDSRDFDLPLEFPKESYPSSSKFGESRGLTNYGSLNSNYPSIAIGIDRQGPPVTVLPKFFITRAGIPTSKNINDDPTTTNYYDFLQASTLSPVEIYGTSVEPAETTPQSNTSSDPNLSYEQYLIQQIIKPIGSQQPMSFFNVNKQDTFADSIVDEYVTGKSNETDVYKSKLSNIYSPSNNLTPQIFFKTQYPGKQYDDNFANISQVTIPAVKSYNSNKIQNQQPFDTYYTQSLSDNSSGTIIPQDFENSIKTSISSTYAPSLTNTGTTIIDNVDTAIPSFEFSSMSYSPSGNNLNINYTKNVPPQSIPAKSGALITNYENILTPEGFSYSFDTSNGIHVDESGTANGGVKANGSYSFFGDNGQLYSVEYTADENGFVPRGDHLPTAPPIPDAILRGIEQAKKNKQLGFIDDGSYDEAKYGHSRYNGLVGRQKLNRFNKITKNKPITNIEHNNAKHESDEITDFSISSKRVNDYDNGLFSFETDNVLKSGFKGNEINFSSPKDGNEGNQILRNKLKGDLRTSNTITNKELTPNNDKNNNNSQKYNNDVSHSLHLGYEYSIPQNKLTTNDKKNLQTRVSNIKKNGGTKFHDVTYAGINETEFHVTPDFIFYNKSVEPNSNSPLPEKAMNNPITLFNNINYSEMQHPNIGITTPGVPVSSRGFNQNRYEIPKSKNVFDKFEPTFASTTVRPYKNQFSYTSKEDENRFTYPSSSLRSQYSVSKTTLPSEISSSFTSTTNSYPYTTPTTSHITSTLRPVITSGQLGIISSEPGYLENISKQEEAISDPRFSGKPKTFGQRIIGSTGLDRGKSTEIPVTQTDVPRNYNTRLGLSSDPISQTSRISSSTEQPTRENFSGPNQPQRFDPENGYYY